LEANVGLVSVQGGEEKWVVHHGAGSAERRMESPEKQRCPWGQARLGAPHYCPLVFLYNK